MEVGTESWEDKGRTKKRRSVWRGRENGTLPLNGPSRIFLDHSTAQHSTKCRI